MDCIINSTLCFLLLFVCFGSTLTRDSESQVERPLDPYDKQGRALGSCYNKILPGLDKLGQGVDITMLDMRQRENGGYRKQLVDFTCEEGKTWGENNEFLVPDQVSRIIRSPSEQLASNVRFTKTMAQVEKLLTVNVGIDVNTVKGAFAATSTYSSAQRSITIDSFYLAHTESTVTLFQAFLLDYSLLKKSRSMENAIYQLPDEFDASSSAKYRDFVTTYGTHYFEIGYMGGTLLFTSQIEKNYVKRKGEDAVKAEVRASYMKLLTSHGATNLISDSLSSEFEKRSEESAECMGGTTDLFGDETQSYGAWKSTLPSMPWLMSGTLRTIADLIPEGPKRVSISKAVDRYMLRARIRSLQRILDEYSTTEIFKGELTRLSNEANELMEATFPDEKQVDALEEKIEEFRTQFKCPLFWLRYGDKCFRRFSGNLNHHSASGECYYGSYSAERSGARMASFHTPDEWEFIRDKLIDNETLWLGGKKFKAGTGSGRDFWEWDDQSEWDYRAFDTGSPNKGGKNDRCLVSRKGKWDDNDCSAHMGHLCEINIRT